MSAPDVIKSLVERFEQNKEQYRSGRYNETQLRREFLDPFFEALGWDVFNKGGYAETYKTVIHEDSLEIEGEKKAPDYAFRVGGQRKFFVEAKKPSVKIETNIDPAFQLRRYAWSAKLPLSILTDFEEFAVYDCRIKPDKGDKASVGRIKLYSYKDYLEKWDEIAAIFSSDAVLKGSFDQYAESMKTKKGTTEVDDAFLEEIERWRELLAKNIALRNQSLNVRELNYAVQMTIDRIVFLRICEDRGVERDEQLKEIGTGSGVYEALCLLFKKADARYNSGLFHFQEEKDASSPADTLSLNLKIDDKPLQDILKNLYYPESPYVFREIPADILGQVYERFLGKVIRLTASRQVKIEEKPEVRKAGGVYYTPTYIVNYIVQNTVGKLLENKTPKDAEKLRILDPACGSGTFPLGAYQYLLDWHLKYYIDNDPEKFATGKKPAIYQTKDGYKLTTSKKKEILLNNIYGVDIDAQAVEVTKLSLLLKVLEGESQETIGSQLSFLQERVLPDLGKNIKCGNSLIGSDYYDGQQLTLGLADDEERIHVNAFNWKSEFSDIFIQGGFDVVIGNPPYIDSEWLTKTNPELREYCNLHYKSAKGNWDIFCIFIEKSLSLCKPNGYSSMIVPNKLLSADYAKSLRYLLTEQHSLLGIRDYSSVPVFPVSVYPIVYIFKAYTKNNSDISYEIMEQNKVFGAVVSSGQVISNSRIEELNGNNWTIVLGGENNNLSEKIRSASVLLSEIATVTGAASVSEAYEYKEILIDTTKELNTEDLIFVNTGTIDRFHILWGIKDTTYIKGKYVRPILPKSSWNKISKNRLTQSKSSKIIIGGMNKRLECVYDSGKVLAGKSTSIIYDSSISLFYLLGIMNSKLISYYYQQVFSGLALQGGYLRIGPPQLKELPIRILNLEVSNEKAQHDKMVSLVERMLALHKQNPKTPQEQERVKREIESTDRGIDKLVYELYGLTEEEIKIVEEK
jgi:predicted type IV restriction endonuclease